MEYLFAFFFIVYFFGNIMYSLEKSVYKTPPVLLLGVYFLFGTVFDLVDRVRVYRNFIKSEL